MVNSCRPAGSGSAGHANAAAAAATTAAATTNGRANTMITIASHSSPRPSPSPRDYCLARWRRARPWRWWSCWCRWRRRGWRPVRHDMSRGTSRLKAYARGVAGLMRRTCAGTYERVRRRVFAWTWARAQGVAARVLARPRAKLLGAGAVRGRVCPCAPCVCACASTSDNNGLCLA
jgi:hypothetical protein